MMLIFEQIAIATLFDLGLGARTIKRFEDKFQRLCNEVDENRITIDELLAMLEKEYKATMDELDELEGLSWLKGG